MGGARVELIRSGGETRLGTCYQQIPARVVPPFALDGEPAALLYLINLTAGLLDGDAHLYDVAARAGTRAVVTGQSATRVHPALKSFATQQWRVAVGDDAHLVVLPGPTMPYRGCRYFQYGRVDLAPTGRLVWGDVWLPGRYDRGALSERFQFDRIVQDFEVRRGGRLVYRDRFRWDGPWDRDAAGWYFGGHLAAANLFVGGPAPDLAPHSAADLKRSVFRLDSGDTCVRWCGHPTAVTAELVSTAFAAAGAWAGGPPWLTATNGLAPNHWFSAPGGAGAASQPAGT